MHNIFEISKYSRSYKSEEQQLQEDLITGILVWCIERKNKLLQNIIEKSLSKTEKPILSNSSLDCELQFSMRGEDRKGRADAKITNDNCTIWIENKIVPKYIEIKQVENYHIINTNDDKDDNKNSWLLVITPDDKKDIEERIFNKLNEKHLAKTLWINWLDIYDTCKNMIKDGEDKIILNELTEALEMQGIKPFEGFSEDIKRLKEIEKIGKFFELIKSELQNHDIIKTSKSIAVNFEYPWMCNWFSETKFKPNNIYMIWFDFEKDYLNMDFIHDNKIINDFIKQNKNLIKELDDKIKAIDDKVEIKEDKKQNIIRTSITFDSILSDKNLVKKVVDIILLFKENIVDKLEL